ncbi:phage tail tape measure protein [Pseudomonas sp. Irchel 3E13]|uniref:phage tail tape measure protein n=1 Tax=Pseudomonas sp. Irchel 3E13 TaxID=2008975 RepID=UPI000BA4DB33|nr:phage tail tape measure protein [Pseudomonas sp. Irchel 3E13]
MTDLRVALRVQAHAGESRREIEQINRDLRKAGKEGARSLADESWKASSAIGKVGQVGANSYKVIRGAMRQTAQAGSGTRIEVSKTTAELKEMAAASRKAARDAKTELANTDRQGVAPLRQSVERAESSFRRMAQSSGRGLTALKKIATGVRQEFERLKNFGGTMTGQLAGLGLGVGVVAGLKANAELERVLIRTKQTAGMTGEQTDEWRKDGWRIAKTYGATRADVDTGFNTLIASGVNYDASKKTADAIGQANAITGANPAVLGKAVVAAASAFNIDLNKEGAALELLQKMTVAGRLGNAELENLSDLFPKIGGAAAAAGMSIEQALAFTESLSKVELQPDRLGTLAESTLRVFSNKEYRDQITKTTGIQFFNKDKSSRNPEQVFADLKRKYEAMKTDEQRAKFMGVVFKGMDQDTIRGWRSMLTGERLDDLKSGAKTLGDAEPIFSKDLKENTNSSSGTAARMKATLAEAVDRMATPLNKSFADFGSYLLDDMNLSGEQMLVGGAALGLGGYYAGRGLQAGAGSLLKKYLGGPETLRNIAVGKVLEDATGVESVFVTNWPEKMGGGGDEDKEGKNMEGLGLAALALTAAQVGGASASTDEGRLRNVENSKLLEADQKRFQEAFYRNRMELAKSNPEQSSDWLSAESYRLAHVQTGLTASGIPVAKAQAWSKDLSDRLTAAAMSFPAKPAAQSPQAPEWFKVQADRLNGPNLGLPGYGADVNYPSGGTEGGASAQSPASQALEARLNSLLSKPLVIEVRTDSGLIQAELERRTDIMMRRGG